MQNKISVFLPTRSGSERVKNKNTRTFANIKGGLLQIKLDQLLNCNVVEEVILSTNDPESMSVAQDFNSDKLKVIERPEKLAVSSTDLSDLVNYVPSICNFEHILWTHVTSPLINTTDYEAAINLYFKSLVKGYDSLMSVKEIQNFIWSKELRSVINKQRNDSKKWPRTQDLQKVYEVNSAIFIASRKVYSSLGDRIGERPYLLSHDQIKSTDVDWEDDFKLAEIIYEHYAKH